MDEQPASSKHTSVSVNRISAGASGLAADVDYRQKVMMEKERRRKEEEDKHIRQLDAIRLDNATRRQEAIIKQQAQYRPSAGLKMALSSSQDPQVPA